MALVWGGRAYKLKSALSHSLLLYFFPSPPPLLNTPRSIRKPILLVSANVFPPVVMRGRECEARQPASLSLI